MAEHNPPASGMAILRDAQKQLERIRGQSGIGDHPGYTRIGAGGELNQVERVVNRVMAKCQTNPIDFEALRLRELESRRLSLDADRVAWAYETSGIPKVILREILAGELEWDAQAVKLTQDMVGAGKRLIGLLGPAWTGKTAAACWVLWSRRVSHDAECLECDDTPVMADGRFITTPRVLRIPAWELDEHWVMTVPFLVFDDLGRETEEGRYRVEEVFMRRYDEDLVTIFTANLRADEFAEVYDERVISRIRRVGVTVDFTESFDPVVIL